MTDNHVNNMFGTVPNDSTNAPNGSERNDNRSEPFHTSFRTVPNERASDSQATDQNRREVEPVEPVTFRTVPNRSERDGNHSEQSAEPFRTVPNDSDVFPNESGGGSEPVPNCSERTPTNASEQFRTAPSCSTEHTDLTITVREAARIFEEAGVPRTERAITNWCNQNARGVTRLECCYNNEERKYYIAPNSISKVIQEERKKTQYTEYREGHMAASEGGEERSEHVLNDIATDRVQGTLDAFEKKETLDTRQATNEPKEHTTSDSEPQQRGYEAPLREDDQAKLKELQMENFDLRVQLEGQKYLVRQFDSLVDGERERHEREKLSLVDRLTEARHQIGSLEQKLLQLEAGTAPVRDAQSSDGTRDAATYDVHTRRDDWQHTGA
jgi:hypothetical protein